MTNELVLTQCPLFIDFTDAEAAALYLEFEQESYEKGEVIIQEGNANQILWVILSGNCEVIKTTNSQEHQLAVLEPGAVFGEMSFFKPAPHSASIRSLSEVKVLRMWRKKYDELIEACPTAALKIAVNTARVMADRLSQMDDWICKLAESGSSGQLKQEWTDFRSKLYTDWQF